MWSWVIVRYLLTWLRKIPQNHANQEVPIFVFTSRTPEKLPRLSRICTSKKLSSIWKMSHERSKQVIQPLQWWSSWECAGQAVRLDTGSVAKKSAEFLLYLLRYAENDRELKGLDVDSLAIEHIHLNKAPKTHRHPYRVHAGMNSHVSSPCHMEMILTERKQTVPKPAEDRHRRQTAQKTLRNQNLWLGNKVSIK